MSVKKNGKQTFIVEVISHQKYTWQGQIHWIQGDKKIPFRSVMEMLHLIDSVFSDEDDDMVRESDMEATGQEKG